MLNFCARESKAQTGRFMREKMLSDHGIFSSHENLQRAANGRDSWGFFRDGCTGLLRSWMLARAPASSAEGLHHHHGPRYFNFPFFCTMCGLEKLGLIDQNGLERNLSAFLLRTLAVGRRQQSESIEVALDME